MKESFVSGIMFIHVGTSGFGYGEWKGKFYPENIRAEEMLGFYSQRFDTVEINSTFYRMPTGDLLESWADRVPKGFVFAIKAPAVITHRKRLRNALPELERFLRALSVLGKKLGPVLFLLPGTFRADRPLLEEFLGSIESNVSCAFDFRSPTWNDPEIHDLLRKKKACLCVEDADESPAKEMAATADWGYIRLRRSRYTKAALGKWREKILAQKWKRAFVFFKHEGEAGGPKTALRFGGDA